MLGKDTYEPRYCAFVDILGFRGLLNGLRQGTIPYEQLGSLLTIVHTPQKGSTISWDTEFRAQSISDAVAISTVVNHIGLTQMFHALETLSVQLLGEGYFVRGALVKGMLYHDDKMVFGDALVEAHRLESTVVRFPRIMATRDIAHDIEQYIQSADNWKDVFANRLKQADDGPFYVHVLRGIEAAVAKDHVENVNRTPGDSPTLKLYSMYREKIQQRFDESVDDPHHFEKVQWFANYWNAALPYGTQGFATVTGPGLGRVT
jgi:hypothetical protein